MIPKSSDISDISHNDGNSREVRFYPEKGTFKEMSKLPERLRDRFLASLLLVAKGQPPTCDVSPLSSQGQGVYELKINGRPAWRCIYYTGQPGQIVVLHVCEKTTNGADRQIANVVGERLKALRSELKAQ